MWLSAQKSSLSILHDLAPDRRFLDGRYTPLAVERLCEEIGDSGGRHRPPFRPCSENLSAFSCRCRHLADLRVAKGGR